MEIGLERNKNGSYYSNQESELKHSDIRSGQSGVLNMPPGTLLLAEFERKMSGDSRFGAWTKWAVVPLTEAGKAQGSQW